MNEVDLEATVSSFIHASCTPLEEDRDVIEAEYKRLKSMLEGRTFKSGSYARFTSTKPVNDLDVIWVMPETLKKALLAEQISVNNVLEDLADNLRDEYRKLSEPVEISAQSHSIVIEFPEREGDFSIDVVPARELPERNEFDEPFYEIPEVGLMSRRKREKFYAEMPADKVMVWIKTDPKGYREAAKITNSRSKVFRKATKLLKKWARAYKSSEKFGGVEFKLKSFHIEQIVKELVDRNPSFNITTTIKTALIHIEDYLREPYFLDRAQTAEHGIRHTDEYVTDLTPEEKSVIKIGAMSGLVLLNAIKPESSSDEVLNLLNRFIAGEEMIEAYSLHIDANTIRDKSKFRIDGKVEPKDGFAGGWLSESLPLQKGLTRGKDKRKISFEVRTGYSKERYTLYWKVRNTGEQALAAHSLRGEITRGHTRNNPETTEYLGSHFVTCYLVDETNMRVAAMDTLTVKII
ncbi:nucleotidyltransferase [Candidatus Peregrinibacteria bacterium]|nr:MAG: nucleotidyltransferase [Candidatus Peregrinibacteria bacterium]